MIDGECLAHKLKTVTFDCDGKTPRWSRKCIKCGHKDYSSEMGAEYVTVPTVVFSDGAYRLPVENNSLK